MNMGKAKKLMGMLLCCALVGTMLAGCGSEKDQPAPATEKKANLRVGVLANLNASEKKLNEILQKIEEEAGDKAVTPNTYIYYDNLNSMQMGLSSKSIDAMSTYQSVADYLMARHSEFTLSNYPVHLKDAFCCAVRKDDTALQQAINTALDSMKADGTLDRLTKEYITELKKGEEPPKVEINRIEGADTLKVAVTGDLPPIDLILSDGSPAGFNTAVLAEMSKRMGKNIEIISVESAARSSTLTSKRADVIFWAIAPTGNDPRPADIDIPTGAVLTHPYFQDDIVHVDLKK